MMTSPRITLGLLLTALLAACGSDDPPEAPAEAAEAPSTEQAPSEQRDASDRWYLPSGSQVVFELQQSALQAAALNSLATLFTASDAAPAEGAPAEGAPADQSADQHTDLPSLISNAEFRAWLAENVQRVRIGAQKEADAEPRSVAQLESSASLDELAAKARELGAAEGTAAELEGRPAYRFGEEGEEEDLWLIEAAPHIYLFGPREDITPQLSADGAPPALLSRPTIVALRAHAGDPQIWAAMSNEAAGDIMDASGDAFATISFGDPLNVQLGLSNSSPEQTASIDAAVQQIRSTIAVLRALAPANEPAPAIPDDFIAIQHEDTNVFIDASLTTEAVSWLIRQFGAMQGVQMRQGNLPDGVQAPTLVPVPPPGAPGVAPVAPAP